MTSLIDVIFLLLLFFMLSSTFSRFGEVELTAAAGGDNRQDRQPVFVSLQADTLRVNGRDAELSDLKDRLKPQQQNAQTLSVIVSLGNRVTAQRLTDFLAVVNGIAGLSVTVLETS
ncbi:biopolymer transporter ExbD [Phaeobacter italicus]|uniref:biopolymer transporter ExbD n=1 Tax=Phaeobacter italicus TaxID=481446 RepID=UPI0024324ED0|nr:biopolymer transporter ExbD [Phaeobacter italicus]